MFAETTQHCPMISSLRRDGARGPWLGILGELIKMGGTQMQFMRHAERPWSSGMFTGARHTFVLQFEGPAAISHGEALIAALPEHEFNLTGRLVADATVSAAEHVLVDNPTLTIEVELLVLDSA